MRLAVDPVVGRSDSHLASVSLQGFGRFKLARRLSLNSGV
jgi:hypothetical protein